MELLDALLLLKEKALTESVDYDEYGICINLSILIKGFGRSFNFVEDNCTDWKFFSGNLAYPIKDYYLGNLWEGEQLELRLSLLDHLITKAKLLQVYS